jgi:hypothetical protein
MPGRCRYACRAFSLCANGDLLSIPEFAFLDLGADLLDRIYASRSCALASGQRIAHAPALDQVGEFRWAAGRWPGLRPAGVRAAPVTCDGMNSQPSWLRHGYSTSRAASRVIREIRRDLARGAAVAPWRAKCLGQPSPAQGVRHAQRGRLCSPAPRRRRRYSTRSSSSRTHFCTPRSARPCPCGSVTARAPCVRSLASVSSDRHYLGRP